MRKVLFLSLFFIVFACSQAFSKEVVADKIVATVEGQPITAYELSSIAGFYGTKDLNTLVNRVIDDYVIMYYSKKMGIVVSDEDINKFIANMASRNNMSVEDFLASVKKSGIDLDYYKEGVRLGLYRRKFASKMFAYSIRISKEDVERYYNLHKKDLRANPVFIMNIIAIKNKKTAEYVFKKLQNGADFSKLKNRFSLDKEAVKAIPLSAFNKEIQAELSGLKKGDISNIIEASGVFYIVKIIDKKNAEADLNSMSGRIKNILFEKKIKARVSSWLKMVKSRTDIEIF